MGGLSRQETHINICITDKITQVFSSALFKRTVSCYGKIYSETDNLNILLTVCIPGRMDASGMLGLERRFSQNLPHCCVLAQTNKVTRTPSLLCRYLQSC